jgi:hypothetical protein
MTTTTVLGGFFQDLISDTTVQSSIVNVILNNGGAVFGGFVRDLIAGVTPNDIDCFLPKNKILNVLTELSVIGTFHSYGALTIDYSSEGLGSRWELVDKDHVSVMIDIVISGSKHLPDCDVNRLTLTNSGIRVMNRYCNSNNQFVALSSIISHIHHSVFVPEENMSNTRWDKMIAKGYNAKNYAE